MEENFQLSMCPIYRFVNDACIPSFEKRNRNYVFFFLALIDSLWKIQSYLQFVIIYNNIAPGARRAPIGRLTVTRASSDGDELYRNLCRL